MDVHQRDVHCLGMARYRVWKTCWWWVYTICIMFFALSDIVHIVLCAVIPSVRCHCWTDDVKGIQSAKSLVPTVARSFFFGRHMLDWTWLTWSNGRENKLVKEKLKIVVAVVCCQLPTIVTLSLSTLSHIFDRKSDLWHGFWAFSTAIMVIIQHNIMVIIQQVRKWPEETERKVGKFKKEWKVNGKQVPHSTMAVIAWYVLLSMVSSQVQAMTPSEHLLYH